MFIYKKTEELEKLTPAELDTYKSELKAHEIKERNEAVSKAVSEAVAEYKKNDAETQAKAKADLEEFLGKEVAAQLLEKNSTKELETTELVKAMLEASKNFDDKDKFLSNSITIKAAALMTTANVVSNVSGGLSPLFGNYIDNEIGHTPKPDLAIVPLITVKTQPGTEAIYHTSRYNEDGDAAFILEGGLKPLADAEWKTDKAEIKELAVRWKFTKRLMNHAPSVVADFAEHANELMEQKMDDGVLTGNGLTNELLGITANTVSSAFVVPNALAQFYASANIFDVIMAAAMQVRLANFKGQLTAVLNSSWEAVMMGYKNKNGDYILPSFVAPDGSKVGSVNVIFRNKIAATHILLGDLKKFNLVIAESVTYDEGYENDDFSKNLVSKKLESFMGTYIKRADAGSIIYDEISSILTDIESPEPTVE